MASPASFAKHPIHPMIIPFPIGLWIFSLAADIIYLAGAGETWAYSSLYTMGGGIIGAAVAAVPGLIDLSTMKQPVVKNIAIWHMSINIIALILFLIDFLIRIKNITYIWPAPFILSIIGVVLIGISGYLGGEMVFRHGVAVDTSE